MIMETLTPKTKKREARKNAIVWMLVMAASIALAGIYFLPPNLQATTTAVPINNWTATSSLPVALSAVNAVAHKDTIYVIGGRIGSGDPTDKVYKATINADGSLSTWSTTSPLPESLYLHSVTATDTHMYAFGGWRGSPPVQQTVYRAAFLSNGSLSAWQNVNRNYPTRVDLHDSVVVNNKLYSVGGFNGDVTLRSVYYASIFANGSLSSWQSGPPLPTPLRRHSIAAYNNVIYVVGGFDSTELNSDGREINGEAKDLVYYAQVNADGTIGAWQTGPSLPAATFYHQLVVHDGRLVALAGRDNDAEFNQVYSANINTNGSLDSWQPEPALPNPQNRFAAVSVEKNGSDYIYVIGGFSNNQLQTSVYHSAVPPLPTPTSTPTPTATPTPMPTPTPPVSVYATLSSDPSHWVAPGEDITYTIVYGNDGTTSVSNAAIDSPIPANTELVTGTISSPASANVSASSAGSTISWNIGTIAPNQTGTVMYTVKRTVNSEPSPDTPIDLEITGPTSAAANAPITYTLTVTNQGIDLRDALVSVTIPEESQYLANSANGTLNGNKIEWTIQDLLRESSTQFTFVVSAQQTIILKEYYAEATIPFLNQITNTIEDKIIVTDINGTPPAGTGDDVIISNNSARLSWTYNGQLGSLPINSVVNPGAQSAPPVQNSSTYLPLVTR